MRIDEGRLIQQRFSTLEQFRIRRQRIFVSAANACKRTVSKNSYGADRSIQPPGCDQARTAECREAGSEEQLLKEIRSLEQHVRQASGQCAAIGPNGVVGHRISNLKRNEHTSPAFLHKH